MKKSYKSIRWSLLALLSLLIPALNSCKQEASDISSLLATVPSSSGTVVGINLRTLLDKAGCKVDGSSIKAGEEVKQWLETLPANSPSAETLRLFLNGDAGIDPLGAVVFSDAYNMYATAMLADTDKFLSFVEQRTGEKFQEQEGSVKTCGNVAVLGAQMWVCFSSYNTIDAKAVKNYASLAAEQNFLSKDYSAPIAKMEKDVVGWSSINSVMKNSLPFGKMAQVNLIMGALYDNPSSLAFSLDFEKGRMETKTVVLNEKGDRAKFLLPTKKADLDLLKGLGAQGDVIVAGYISKDLVKKVEKMLSSLGGGMFSEQVKALGSLDGTVAVVSGAGADGKDGLNGVATTDGNPSADLMNLLSRLGSTRKEEKLVYFSDGTPGGPLNVEETAGYMKGAWVGMAFGADKLGRDNTTGVKGAVVALTPDGSGLDLDLTLLAKSDATNFILTLLHDLSR